MGEPPLIPEPPSTPGPGRTQWVLGTVAIAIAVGAVGLRRRLAGSAHK